MGRKQHTNRDIFRAVLSARLDFTRATWDVISAEAREFVSKLLKVGVRRAVAFMYGQKA